jgi:hypothetical protein
VEAVPSAPATPSPARIAITPPGTDLQAGGPPYTMPISISGVSELGTVTLSLSYNPAVLRATAVTQGTFLQQGGVATAFAPKIDAVAGRIDIAITRTGNASGVSGNGLLGAIAFQAVAPGVSQISMSGMAMTADGKPITILINSATVTVK